MTISIERWQTAQEHEAAFHRNALWQHIPPEVRRAARGMLQITAASVRDASVLDVGCGPHSIMLDDDIVTAIDAKRSAALDPLRFEPRAEVAYVRAGITRLYEPIEDVNPSSLSRHFDEVWCYNCLQHVRDVGDALTRIKQLALRRVRLFEWVNDAESVVHPHVLSVEQLRNAFAWDVAFTCEREIVGRYTHPDFALDFYAATFARLTR